MAKKEEKFISRVSFSAENSSLQLFHTQTNSFFSLPTLHFEEENTLAFILSNSKHLRGALGLPKPTEKILRNVT